MRKIPYSSIKNEDIWGLEDERDHILGLLDPNADMDDELYEHVKYLLEKGLRYLLDRDEKFPVFHEHASRITPQKIDWYA